MLIKLPNTDWVDAESIDSITSVGDEVRVWVREIMVFRTSRQPNEEADEYKDYLAAMINEAKRQSRHPAPDTSPQASQEP